MVSSVEETENTPIHKYNLRSRKPDSTTATKTETSTSAGPAPQDTPPDQKDMSQNLGYFGLGSDFFSVCVLMFLYVLQGVPLGLSSSIPIMIQQKISGYSQQAAFSIVSYPFSCKLLWAPLVDCVYSTKLGRRKSWLVPLQYCIGGAMLYIPSVIGDALGNNGGEIQVGVLAGWFCFLTFLAATQDIAVDGWALTMLSSRNVGLASTCNSVGQTVGYFFGYLGFLALESPMFCNLFRSVELDVGCVTMESYLRFWGVVFILTTTFVATFVREKDVDISEQDEGFVETYKSMMKIIRLKSVLVYIGCIFVIKASFAPLDSLTGLKLMEAGLSKDNLVTLSALLIPLQVLLPLIITKYTNSQFPLNTYVGGVFPRIFSGILITLLVYYTFSVAEFGPSFYVAGLIIQVLYSVAATMMFVSQMMFNARVSDVKMGGTYMTLLNTLINLSGTLPQTISLWLVDRVTSSTCVGSETVTSCYMDKDTCTSTGGTCSTETDGFFVLVSVGTCVALLWKWKLSKVFLRLQTQAVESWHVSSSD
ncbi:hypothetical protein ACHWQZ_G015256 [Mnemiopsis leidyi]